MAVVLENYQPIFQLGSYAPEESVFLDAPWPFLYDNFEVQPFKSPTLPVFSCQRAKVTSVAPEARAPAWWASELAPSIHETLKKKEKNLNRIEMKSPQICFRAETVDFISAVCLNLDISTGTKHTAVRLMDYFMDGHNVMYYRLKLVALTCLLIAAKFEERDDSIPSIDALQYAAQLYHSNITFSIEEIKILELYALKYFKWNVSRPGVAHFIDYYQHESMNSCGDNIGIAERKLMERQAQEFLISFMEPVIREQQFLCHNPSKIAAAIVCVVRICMRMDRVWTPQLHSLTSYSLEDLQPIANLLLRLYDEECGR